jgi:hypothetical protein
VVALDVVDDALVPPEGLLPLEVAPDDEAAAAAQFVQRLGRDRACRDVGVVDDGPDGLSPLQLRSDLCDPGRHALLDGGEHLLHRAPGRRDPRPQRGLDLPDRRLEVGRLALPVRKRGKRCYLGLDRGDGHGEDSL